MLDADERLATVTYPVTIRPSGLLYVSVTIFCGLFATLFAGFAAVTLWYPFQTSRAGEVWLLLIILSGAILFGAGFWQCLVGRIGLLEDGIESYNGFWTRKLGRGDIKGYRQGQYGSIILESGRGLFGSITISAYFVRDPIFQRWLSNYDDTEVLKAQTEQAAFEDDPNLGLTPAERREKVARIRTWGQYVNYGALACVFWILLHPRPYRLAILVAALSPLAWLALRGAFKWYFTIDTSKTDPIPAFENFLFGLPIVLSLRALLDVNVMDWKVVLEIAAVLSTIALAAGLLVSAGLRKMKYIALLFWPLSFAYFYGATVEANMLFDEARPVVYAARVAGKSISSGKTTTYNLSLAPWGPDRRSGDESVMADFYRHTSVGQTVCVYVFPGRLHMRWYDLGKC
jgi:hypothetical protein